MKLAKTLFASAALLAVVGANASVVGSLGGGAGTFATLSGPGTFNSGGTLSGSVTGTIVGGEVYTAKTPTADDVVPGVNFLAAGPTSGLLSTLTLTTPVSYISFLWGSPDSYNLLTVNSTGAGPNSQNFTAASLGFPSITGNQNIAQAVQFQAVAGGAITSLVFSSDSQDAFEVSQFTTTAPVPEPETYALMLAGLGVVGFMAKRRRQG